MRRAGRRHIRAWLGFSVSLGASQREKEIGLGELRALWLWEAGPPVARRAAPVAGRWEPEHRRRFQSAGPRLCLAPT